MRIVNYPTETCGFEYVLTSFLQNDPLEYHFGLYRAGGDYHITYCQILETEHRLKLASILKLFYTTGTPEIGLKEFLASFSSSVKEHYDSNSVLTDYIIELKDISFI